MLCVEGEPRGTNCEIVLTNGRRMVLRESLEWIRVRILYALWRTDASLAYAITHIVKTA